VYYSFVCFPGFDCSAAADYLRSQVDVLVHLDYDSMACSLYAKDVITNKERQKLNPMLNNAKMMYLLVDIIIPSLKLKCCEKYKGFLQVMESSEDIVVRNIAERLGKFYYVLIVTLLDKKTATFLKHFLSIYSYPSIINRFKHQK